MMNKLQRLIRHDWPVHFFLLLTNWLPDNTVFLRLRGLLISPFLGACGRNLRLGRNVTLYNPSRIYFGNDVYAAFGCWFMAGGNIRVEDEVLLGPYCVIASSTHSRASGSFRFAPPPSKCHSYRARLLAGSARSCDWRVKGGNWNSSRRGRCGHW